MFYKTIMKFKFTCYPERNYTVFYDDQCVPTDVLYDIKINISQEIYEDIKRRFGGNFNHSETRNAGADKDGDVNLVETEFTTVKTQDDIYLIKVEKKTIHYSNDLNDSSKSVVRHSIIIFPIVEIKMKDEPSDNEIEEMVNAYLFK